MKPIEPLTQDAHPPTPRCSLDSTGRWRWAFAPALETVAQESPGGASNPVWTQVQRVTEGWGSLEALWPGARVLKSNALRTVLDLPTGPDVGLVVKQYHLRHTPDRLKYLIVPSRARAEWAALTRLAAAGVPVPRVLAYGEQRRGPVLVRAGLIMERLEDVTPLATWLDDAHREPCERRSLLGLVGRTLAGFHQAGARHSDLHSGNILVSPSTHGSAGWQVHLIDHHVCRFGFGAPRDHRRRRDLAKFVQSMLPSFAPGELVDLLTAYDDARQPPRQWAARVDGGVAAVGRDLEARARRLETVRLRSRSKRCWKNSSEFVREDRRGWRVYRRRSLEGADLEPFLSGQVHLDPEFKRRPDSAVGVARLGSGQFVVAKTRKLTRWWRRLAHLVVPGPLEQAWGAARALDVRGIPTPKALALLTRRRFGLPAEAILLTERIDHARSLWSDLMERYYPPAEKARTDLVDRIAPLAGWVRRFHDTGIYHRDLNPANLLVASTATEDRFFVIDLDSVVAGRRLTDRRRQKNLVQLGLLPEGHVTPRDRLRFLRDYDQGELRYYNAATIQAIDGQLAAEVVDMIGRISLREWQTARRARQRPRSP